MFLALTLSVVIFFAASMALQTRSASHNKGNWEIIFWVSAFTTAYASTAILLLVAGFSMIGVIAFIAGMFMLVRRIFLHGLKF